MKFKIRTKKAVAVDEFIPAVAFMIFAAFGIFLFILFSNSQEQHKEETIQIQIRNTLAAQYLREFAEQYHTQIVEAYRANDYNALKKSATEFFDKKYAVRSYGWELNVFDDNNERKFYIIGGPPSTYIFQSASLIIPLRRTDKIQTVRLTLLTGEKK